MHLKADKKRKQKTIVIAGEKVKIVSVNKSHFCNHIGFNVTINGDKFFSNVLLRQEAIDGCLKKWLKKNNKRI